LANGGTATYSGGTGTNTLTFSYTPAAGQTTSDLATASSNALTGTITDLGGNAVTAAGFNNVNPTGTLPVDVIAPIVSSIVYGTNDGTLSLGETVTLTVTLSEAVNVTGTPTLALANGGTATYSGGTGTNTLTFSYTAAADQTTADLATAASNALTGTITDLAGNAVTAAGFDNFNPTGTLAVDGIAPTFTSATTSVDGFKVILTYNEPLRAASGAKTFFAVSVAGLAATVSSVDVSGSNIELTLATSIGAGQAVTVGYTAPVAVAADNDAVQDIAGNHAATIASTNVTNNSTVDKPPMVFSIAYGTNDGTLAIGETVTLTVTLSEAVNVTGTPTLALANGGTATYTNGSGTNTLTFSYTAAAGQTTADLATASSNALTGTIKDFVGKAVTAAGFNNVNPTGTLAVDGAAPTVSTFYPANGATVTPGSNIVLTFSEPIARGWGTITLRSGSVTGTIVESFDAWVSSRLFLSGSKLTIDPSNQLDLNTQYFVAIAAGSITDLAGNAYAGISSYGFMSGNVVINGTAAIDRLTGTNGTDTINGLAGDDIITGGPGTDSMDGGEGSDLYIVAASADHVAAEIADTGASGTDEVRFTSTIAGSTLTLYAGDAGIEKVVIGTGMDLETTAETDRTGTTALNVDASALSSDITVWDNYGNNVITGGSGNDVLWGSYGNDILIGGDGFDQLCGGLGTDTLTGGNGADWFIFKSNPYSGSNADTITDFTSGTDQLQFSKAIFIGAVNFKGLSGAALGDLSSDAFWSGAGVTTAHDADDRFIYNTTNGYLYYDNDGNALRDQAVLVAILGATTPLVFTDLQIIV
jgi:uncharacterized repeat protein (TIGR02059 family)